MFWKSRVAVEKAGVNTNRSINQLSCKAVSFRIIVQTAKSKMDVRIRAVNTSDGAGCSRASLYRVHVLVL